MRRHIWPHPAMSPADSVYAQPYVYPSTSYGYEDYHQVRIVDGGSTLDTGQDQRYFRNDATTVPAATKVPSKRKSLFRWYSNLVFNYPSTILLASLLLFAGLPLCILHLYPLRLDDNPEKGFDTRGTAYSGPRLTWSQLQPYLLHGSRVLVEQPPPSLEELQVIEPLRKILEGTDEERNRTARSLEDDVIGSLTSVACYEIELLQMDYMAQFVLELDSYDKIFDIETQEELCRLDAFLHDTLAPFASFSPYRAIFHISNFAGCLSPAARDNCTMLTPADLKAFRIMTEYCFRYRRPIIDCSKDCLASRDPIHDERRNCDACELIPGNCSSQMWFDLFYRILPIDIMTMKASAERVYINGFLPVYSYSSYRFQGIDVPLQSFVALQDKLISWGESTTNFRLTGFLFDIKRDILFDSALRDSELAIAAAALVFVLVFVYSLSLGFTLAVFVDLGASVLVSAAVYRFFTPDFPLLNLVAFVLLLSIGSDGAFVLLHAFPSRHQVLDEEAFAEALHHTVTTMFLAQFSTVVPFALNIASSVIAFRLFGLFAGFTLVFNYLLLVTFLPAFLVFQHTYIQTFYDDHCSGTYAKVSACLTKPVNRVRRVLRRFMLDTLPGVLIDGRFVWLFSLVTLTAGGAFMVATNLHLPQYNPLQLFVNSNPHEWYDNNAEQLFEFVARKIALPLTVRLIYGFDKAYATSHFNPLAISNVTQNRAFALKTVDDVRQLARDLQSFRTTEFALTKGAKFWPERFLDWSVRTTCTSDSAVCCNVSSPFYGDEFLDYCLRVSTSQLVTGYNDTPIYHNVSFDLVGYTALLPTKLRYSHKFANLSDSIRQYDTHLVSAFTPAMFYTTEWTLMSTWYDLQRSIISDCVYSFAISFVVVFAFAAALLRWRALLALITIAAIVTCTVGAVVALGWEIGVLEAVILVLVVSLSFDYTLHYGAAVPSLGCRYHRIAASIRRAIVPVSMASCSSVLAGALLLMSATHAFHRVATFLVVSTVISWLFATFFFLPVLYLCLSEPGENDSCPECDRIEQLAFEQQQQHQAVQMHVIRGHF